MITNKKSRLTALLLVLVLMMSMLPAAYAAGDVVPDVKLSTNKGSIIYPGDTVSFTIQITNKGDDNWFDVEMTSSALSLLELRAGTVRIDGATSGYTLTSQKLKVAIGTIAPGVTKTVTFDTVVSDDILSVSQVTYSFIASGYNTNGDQRYLRVAKAFTPLGHEPVINPVTEGDPAVTGEGRPGAVVIVTLPDNNTYDATVASDGTWSLDVPSGMTLLEGQTIIAYQTESHDRESDPIQTTVLPNPNPKGEAKKTSTNTTTLTGNAKIGDVIEYTITAKNTSTPSSQWVCIVTDALSEYVDFISGSVKVNNTDHSYDYNAATRVLKVDLGNIAGGVTRTLTFQVRINEKANGQKIENTADVGGIITPDPDPIDVIKSDAPTIDEVLETADEVTGTGVPGAEIVVTFPDGKEEKTTVGNDEKWSVDVPDGTTLTPGQEITAVQTEPDKNPSDKVSTVVQPDPTVVKWLAKESRNLTTTTGDKAHVGDVIEFKITAGNSGTKSSTWLNCIVTDTLPEGLTFVAGSLKVGGDPYSNYTYTGRLLTVNLGDIIGGDVKVITFQVTIDNDAEGKITNIAYAENGDIEAKDPDPIDVIGKSPNPTIDEVKETADEVTGTGEPGAEIVVTFPDGEKETAIVDEYGDWKVDVPPGTILEPGKDITADQTVPGKDTSDEVSTEIQPDDTVIKSLKKTSENKTTLTGDTANVGDIIEYTITARNDGTASSTWLYVIVTDTLPDGVTFVPGSVRVGGNLYSNYTYTGRLLTVDLGNIVGQTEKVITFRVTINADAHGLDIVNTANVGDEKAEDPDPPKVKYKSDTPIIDDVIESAKTVTGTGVPNATITVTFPGGGGTVTATVNGDNTWTVNVPSNLTLMRDDVIYAVQQVNDPDYDVSDQASTIVLPNPDPVPSLTKTSENLYNKTGVAKPGDTIKYTIIAKNDGIEASVWTCIVEDVLHEGLTYVAGSVKIDGVTVNGLQHSYNSATRTLTVNVGAIGGGKEKVITFECTINTEAYGKTIDNTATVVGGDEKGDDKDPPIVIDKSPTPTIDKVLETDDIVTGTGEEEGAVIVVTFPDDSTRTAVVDENKKWQVEVPDNVTLEPNQEIKAVQTVDGMDPSDEAKTVVVADKLVFPNCSIYWENISGGKSAKAGSIIEYEIGVWNEGTASSVWPAVTIIELNENTSFVAGSISIDGKRAEEGTQYTYNSSNHTLTVYLGDIKGSIQEKTIRFRASVNLNVPDTVTELDIGVLLTTR